MIETDKRDHLVSVPYQADFPSVYAMIDDQWPPIVDQNSHTKNFYIPIVENGLNFSDPAEEHNALQIQNDSPRLQKTLAALVYSVGEIDGIAGPLTRRALMEFQAAQCLQPTGEIDATTARVLLRAGQSPGPCAGAQLPDGIDANTPLVTGIYVDDPLLCAVDELPYETVHLQQRIIRGDFIVWGYE